MIKMGVVGTGFHVGIAKMHIGAYVRMPNVVITALYDTNREYAEKYKAELGLNDAMVCDSYQQLLTMVDAVTICTPNAFHVDLAIQALEQGKHLLCEKPLGLSKEECRKLTQKAAQSNLVCGTGFCYRFVPGYRYMKKMIDEGLLGRIYYLRAELGGNRIANPQVELEWRMQRDLSGGGAMVDFGSHLLDLADVMLAESCGKIIELQAIANTFIETRKAMDSNQKKEVTNEDVGFFQGRTQAGTLLSFSTSRVGGKHSMEVVGEGGFLEFDGSRPEELKFMSKAKDGAYQMQPQVIKVPQELYIVDEYGPKQGFEVNFYLQNKEFIDAILGGEEFSVSLQRGQYIQSLTDAVIWSSQTGQRVMPKEEL